MGAKHTPTPWEVSETPTAIVVRSINPVNLAPKSVRHNLCKMTALPNSTQAPYSRADADFIVLAVNSHDALVSVLADSRRQIASIITDGAPTDWSAWLADIDEALSRIPDIQIKGAA